MLEVSLVLKNAAKSLGVSKEEILKEGLITFLRKELVRCETEYAALCAKYGVKSVEEMERLYEKGKIEEKGTLEDFMRIDFLEDRIAAIKGVLVDLT